MSRPSRDHAMYSNLKISEHRETNYATELEAAEAKAAPTMVESV